MVELQQPHHRGHQAKAHPLWVLNEIDNADKHRLVQPVLLAPEGMHFDGQIEFVEEPPDGDPPFDQTINGDPLEHGTEVMTLTAKYPVERLKVNFGITLRIALDVRPLDVSSGPFLPLLGSLAEIGQQVGWVIGEVERATA